MRNEKDTAALSDILHQSNNILKSTEKSNETMMEIVHNINLIDQNDKELDLILENGF